MKKLFAVVLAAALVLSLSVSAFALGSPEAEPVHKIHVINDKNGKVDTITLKDGECLTIKANPENGKFTEWKVYLSDGKTPAAIGSHYSLGEGQKLTDSEIHLYPKTDLIVLGCYDGKEPEIEIGQNGEVTSPQTGDSLTLCLVGMMLLALTGMLVAGKKQTVR